MNKVKFTLLAATLGLALAFTFGCTKDTIKSSEATGTVTMKDTASSKLRNKLSEEQRASIPWGIGVGRSTDEQMARTESIAYARAEVAKTTKTMLMGLFDTYTKNVSGEAKRMSEDKINNVVDTQIEGSYVLDEIMEFDPSNKQYYIYSLVLLNPNKVEFLLAAQAKSMEELGLRYDAKNFQDRQDKIIAEARAASGIAK